MQEDHQNNDDSDDCDYDNDYYDAKTFPSVRYALAEKINHIICVNRSNRMANLADASPKDLWAAAKNGGNVRNGFGSYVSQRLLSNPDLVNEFFAAISNTSAYNDATVWSMHAELDQYSNPVIFLLIVLLINMHSNPLAVLHVLWLVLFTTLYTC